MIFGLFKRKQKSKVTTVTEQLDKKPKYYIPSNSSNPSKKYDLLHDEVLFLDALLDKSVHLKGEYSLLRMSNGAIDVSYNGFPIGKVRFQGRKKYFMYMKNLYEPVNLQGELDDFINYIDQWIKYIEKHIK